MEVLLLKDVRKLGHLGDIVTVKTGYARNYLLPQRLATEPSDENIRAIAEDKKRAAVERARKLDEFRALAASMTDVQVSIERNANPDGKLYGSVTARDIAAALMEQGHPVLAEHVMLDHPIRELDNRVVKLEFADECTTTVKVWVVRAGAMEDAKSDEQPSDGGDDESAEE